MSLQAATVGIDYSYARPGPARIRTAGGGFALRYSAGAASDPNHPSHGANAGKLITPSEFKALLLAGLDVIANDEWYTSRITEGVNAAVQDAHAAGVLWHECGLARGASIYVSWDEAPVPGKWPAVDAYLARYHQVIHANWGYFVDCYAGTPYLRHALRMGRIRYGWRPNAGSWSSDGLPYQPSTGTAAQRAALAKLAASKTPAHIWQTGNYWFSKGADEDLLVRTAVGSHRQALAGATPPPPPPPPVPTPPPVPKRFPAGPGVSGNGQYRELMGDGGHIQIHHIDGDVRYL